MTKRSASEMGSIGVQLIRRYSKQRGHPPLAESSIVADAFLADFCHVQELAFSFETRAAIRTTYRLLGGDAAVANATATDLRKLLIDHREQPSSTTQPNQYRKRRTCIATRLVLYLQYQRLANSH